MISPYDDNYFMQQAYKEAEKALEQDEIPVGAVVVHGESIIARAHNFTEKLNDVTAHAEMQAITAAANTIGGKYLSGCALYVTLEPCVMCAGGLFWSQIDKVVFGAKDSKRGALRYEGVFHPKTKVVGGVLEEKCSSLLHKFFQAKRKG